MPTNSFKPEKFQSKMRQLASDAQLFELTAGLNDFKLYRERYEKWLRRYHRSGGSGLRVAHCRAIAMDVLIEALYSRAVKTLEQNHGASSFSVALFALGGFGRAELSPLSDVDLMFLYPVKKKRPKNFSILQETFNNSILYLLWDLGFKVGHSTRTIKEALAEAHADVQSKNAMLESRRLLGDNTLFKDFEKDYRKLLRKDDVRLYIQQRLQDQEARRHKYGGTIYLQEPDIKNGVGGLRDYQNILWMVRLKLASKDIEDRLANEFLSPEEHSDFVKAYDFLLRVRNELHLQSKRATELLNLDRQPKIAWNLGYRQKEVFKRVELFMRDYYRAAQTIVRTSKYLEQKLLLDSTTHVAFSEVVQSWRNHQRQFIDGFQVVDGQLYAPDLAVFQQDPNRVIRVFRHLQRLQLQPDFELTRLIRRFISGIDPESIRNADSNSAFRAILQGTGNVYPALQLMNETGVLSAFMPEWKSLHCLVQHEFYHRYTADEHTLNTIRVLDGIFCLENESETGKFREALESTEHPSLLYIALLLHDIGKGEGIEDHSRVGEELATRILERLDVHNELRGKILFLIRHHLEMARFWQRYDIDDPDTIQSFSELVGDKEQLRYLYALTYCDSCATSESLWNGFKDTQHTHLYQSTLANLSGPDTPAPLQPVMIPRESIYKRVPELPGEEVEAHLNLMPERYFSYHNTDEIALHLRMVHKLLQTIAAAESLGSLVPVVEWQDDLNLDLTVVHVVTWDRAGLFYKLAGAFSIAGLNIVSSKALTRADHITIDTFYVTGQDGGVVQRKDAFDDFQKHLENALLHNMDPLDEIHRRSEARKKPAYMLQDSHLPASIPPKIEIYHEISLRRTIVELQCNDEIGLLYRFAKAIYKHGFDITFARISTEQHVAADTFYIEPIQPGEPQDADALLELRESLEKIVLSVSVQHQEA